LTREHKNNGKPKKTETDNNKCKRVGKGKIVERGAMCLNDGRRVDSDGSQDNRIDPEGEKRSTDPKSKGMNAHGRDIHPLGL